MSPGASVTPSFARSPAFAGERTSAMTSSPRSRSRRANLPPMNPVAPVTKHFKRSSSDLAAHHATDGADLIHQLMELIREERLWTVGKRVVRIVMDFDHQPIGAGRDRRARHRRDLVANAGAVARIHDDREMRELLHDRDGVQ